MRFNAEATAPQLLPAAEALGVRVDGLGPAAAIDAAAQMIFDWAGRMKLPQRLRDAGVKEADLPGLAQIAFMNRNVQNNPRPVTEASQVEQLLRAAW
jgi:alcohol dehydrogenase class IV